jgi:hypothetical protein
LGRDGKLAVATKITCDGDHAARRAVQQVERGSVMFIGHYSAALVAASDKQAPKLDMLFVAAQLVDIGFFTLVLAGGEAMRVVPGFTVMSPFDLNDMPYTHSLLGSAVWGIGFALLLRALGVGWRGALIGGAVVLSHWFIDLLVHAQDLTLAGTPPKFGLGLWNHPAIAMPLEIAMTAGALWLYLRATRPRGNSWAVPVFMIVLLGLQAFNWFAPPPAAYDASVPISALIAYGLLIGLAAWVARGRMFEER